MAGRRKNPLSFDVSPEARRASDPRSRTAVSMYSPIKQRAVVERFANTPHNYHVILLSPDEVPSGEKRLYYHALIEAAQPHTRPDAVNLLHVGDPVPDRQRGTATPEDRASRESIYTPFIYLHRLGDEVRPSLLYGRGRRSVGYEDPKDPALAALADALAAALPNARYKSSPLSLGPGGHLRVRAHPGPLVEKLLTSRVNSQAVREGYASDEEQAVSDLMALAELTPPERPLLRPFKNFDEFEAHIMSYRFGGYDNDLAWRARQDGYTTPEVVETLNAYMAQHNILWRAWHDRYIRSLYGEIVVI